MCEFCRNDGKEHKIFESDENRWYTTFLSNGKFYIFHRRRGFSGAGGIDVDNCPMCGRKLTEDAMIISVYITIDGKEYVEASAYDNVLYKLNSANDRLAEKEKDYKTVSGLLSQCQMENGGLKERIAELEKENESLKEQNVLFCKYYFELKNKEILFVNDDVFDSERIDKEELKQAMRNMKIEPLKEDDFVSECAHSREWLEDRHQSDCIEINRLNTALEVIIEKYQRLRKLKGL